MNKHYYCTSSKKFDTLLCTIGWFAIQMALITAVSKMVGKVADMFLINKEEKDSPSDDEICTSCEDHSEEVRQ